MWNHKVLTRLDFRTIPIIFLLMICSIFVISATTTEYSTLETAPFLTPHVKNQIKRFAIGWLCYVFFAGLDYHKFRDWSWIIYFTTVLLLMGLFFTHPIQNVHRWYRLPFVGGTIQPSEYAKLSLIFLLSDFLEKKGRSVEDKSVVFQAIILAIIPFYLILKQPDLGSAMVLYPITLGMFYFGGLRYKVVKTMTFIGCMGLVAITLIFSGVVDHKEAKPIVLKFLKPYQYERFDPNTYHHQSAKTAIALGKYFGSGFKKSIFTGRQFLPAAHTDSVFPAFVEEFGFFGAVVMLGLFFGLIYCSFQVTAVARDHFGRVLSAGVAMYLAVHVIINIGMMCGFLPITGVPLILVTYGGSSVTLTMSALGILQSIYTRRFMF